MFYLLSAKLSWQNVVHILLTSCIAVMTACCTDSSIDIILWIYSCFSVQLTAQPRISCKRRPSSPWSLLSPEIVICHGQSAHLLHEEKCQHLYTSYRFFVFVLFLQIYIFSCDLKPTFKTTDMLNWNHLALQITTEQPQFQYVILFQTGFWPLGFYLLMKWYKQWRMYYV